MTEHPLRSLPASYDTLRERLGLRHGLPYTEHWSAAADFLERVAGHALRAMPSTILECSSGLSTLVLARCCQLNGRGHVYSLENGAVYADTTREALRLHGLEGFATVIDAPLRNMAVGGRVFAWYATTDLPSDAIDLLVVDGPPGFIQKHSRYPALPALFDRLSRRCMIYLDDAGREDEREIVRWWLEEYPDLGHEYVETERGCSILYFNV
jgi:predicted O-methyltransferase YrrM